MRLNKTGIFGLLFLSPESAHAELRGKTIEYKQGNTVLEGYVVYDDGAFASGRCVRYDDRA